MEDEDIQVYKILSKQNTKFYSDRPKPTFPNPQPEDYTRGFINRFFCRKTNDKNAEIIEVSDHTASLFLNNPFYIVISVRWKISGPMNTLTRDGVEYEEGVSEHNYRTRSVANQKLPGLVDKLSNLYLLYKN